MGFIQESFEEDIEKLNKEIERLRLELFKLGEDLNNFNDTQWVGASETVQDRIFKKGNL